MHAPLKPHLEVVYRILRYQKTAPGKGVLFKKGKELRLEAYTNANWVGSIMDRWSTIAYCTFLGGDLITWKKQSLVARSRPETEFRTMTQGIFELLWIKIIPQNLKIKFQELMILYCDNKAAINIAHNPIYHDWTKHVEVDRHFIKEKMDCS